MTETKSSAGDFRPSLPRLGLYLLGIAPLLAMLLALAGGRLVGSAHHSSGPLWFIALVLGLFAPPILAGLLYTANVWVRIGVDEVEWADPVGRRHRASRLDIGRAILQPVHHAGHAARRMILIDRAGRRILAVDGRLWDDGQLQALIDALDLGGRVTAVGSAKQLRALFPHSSPWWQAHPGYLVLLAPLLSGGLTVAAVRLLGILP